MLLVSKEDIMKTLLHIVATPRKEDSRTLKVSEAFLHEFKLIHTDWQVEELNVFTADLPALSVQRIEGKYRLLAGDDLTVSEKETWNILISYINQFKSADAYLISTPMWNFSLPYELKHYLDIIVQPRYMFTYSADGPQGLLKGKRMFVLSSSGGDYSLPETKELDFVEPYLKAIFALLGITDIHFLKAQPMDAMGVEIQKSKLEEAIESAKELLRHI